MYELFRERSSASTSRMRRPTRCCSGDRFAELPLQPSAGYGRNLCQHRNSCQIVHEGSYIGGTIHKVFGSAGTGVFSRVGHVGSGRFLPATIDVAGKNRHWALIRGRLAFRAVNLAEYAQTSWFRVSKLQKNRNISCDTSCT